MRIAYEVREEAGRRAVLLRNAIFEGFDQARFAALAGVAKKVVVKIEQGTPGRFCGLEKVARVLGVPVDEINPSCYARWQYVTDQSLLECARSIVQRPTKHIQTSNNRAGLPLVVRDRDLLHHVSIITTLSGSLANTQQAEDEISFISSRFPEDEYYTQWHQQGDLLILAKLAWPVIEEFDLCSKITATMLWKSGQLAREFGHYADGRQYLERALHICKTLGLEKLELACLTELGRLAYVQWDYAGACLAYDEVARRRAALPEAHPLDVAQSYSNFALALSDCGKFDAAATIAQKAVHHANSPNGDWSSKEYAWSSLNLSLIECRRDKPRLALAHYKAGRSAMLKELEGDRHHPLLALFDHKGAEIMIGLGKHTEAVRQSTSAVEVWESGYGEGHPRTVDLSLTVAKAHLNCEQSKLAIAALEKAEHVAASVDASEENRQLREVRRQLAVIRSPAVIK